MSIIQLRKRALTKIDSEIKKELSLIIQLAKNCGIGELYYYIHYLHFIRIIPFLDNQDLKVSDTTKVQANQASDANRYLIQLIKKHCQNRFIHNGSKNQVVNVDLVYRMLNVHLTTTTKYQMKSQIHLSPDFELSGERDQNVRLDLKSILDDPITGKYFFYGARLERDNQNKLNDVKNDTDFIAGFENEYRPFEDLFEKAYQISLDDFINFIRWAIKTVTQTIEQNESKFPTLENGRIDIQSQTTMLEYVSSLIVKKERITEKFGNDLFEKLNFMIFKEKKFDESQYKYDLITRQPILDMGNNSLLFSPELLLDSLFANTHYSLLENSSIKNQYIKRYAEIFLDKIVNVADDYGFTEKNRELDLYEGKKQIGDIDLVLANENNFYLLIEAKSHSLPLDVYFHDYEATQNRLKDLQTSWEKKVSRRNDFLSKRHTDYSIPSSFLYIIVSKQPEIISHFGSILTLSIDEFDIWLKGGDFLATFQNIYDRLYLPDKYNQDVESIESEVIKSSFYPGVEYRKD